MSARFVGINSTFEYQRQVINALAEDVFNNYSGVTTSIGGFTSGIGITNAVQISVSENILTFNVVGVGSTSLTLY